MGKLTFLIRTRIQDVVYYLKGRHECGFEWVTEESEASLYPFDQTLEISHYYFDPTTIFSNRSIVTTLIEKHKDNKELTIELYEFRFDKTLKQTYLIPGDRNDRKTI